MSFEKGDKKDGKHYWLTPPDVFKKLDDEFHFNFDPAPYPRPDGYNALESEWGTSNYVNPPFGGYTDVNGKKYGPTAWGRKAIEENKKGKQVVLVYPIDKWILMILQAGAEVRNLYDIKWHSIEDNLPSNGTGRHIACFIMRGRQDALSMQASECAEV